MAAEEATLNTGAGGGEAAGGGFDFDSYTPFADFADDDESAPALNAEPPLPADAGQQAGAEPQDSTTTGAKEGAAGADGGGAQGAEAGAGRQPGAAEGALSKEDEEQIAKLPEAEREAARENFRKTASFWKHFKDADKPISEVRAHMRERDAARMDALEQDIVAERLADPEAFATDLFHNKPDVYGRLLATADPAYFLQKATGRDGLTLEQVNEALSFHEQHGANADSILGAELLTEEMLDDIEALVPEAAEVIKTARAAAAEKAQGQQPGDAAAQGQKPGEQQQKEEPRTPEQVIEEFKAGQTKVLETWGEAVKPVETLVNSYADEKIGPAPTAAEFEKTPEVAQLRDDKRSLFLRGNGRDMPDFEDGFGKWGQHRTLDADGRKLDFDAIVKRAGEFIRAGDARGAASAFEELKPFATRYAEERLRHPAFARYDSAIARAQRAADPKLPDSHIETGSTAPGSQQRAAATPEEAFGSIALQDALGAGRK